MFACISMIAAPCRSESPDTLSRSESEAIASACMTLCPEFAGYICHYRIIFLAVLIKSSSAPMTYLHERSVTVLYVFGLRRDHLTPVLVLLPALTDQTRATKVWLI